VLIEENKRKQGDPSQQNSKTEKHDSVSLEFWFVIGVIHLFVHGSFVSFVSLSFTRKEKEKKKKQEKCAKAITMGKKT
jgi:hypothetical protein